MSQSGEVLERFCDALVQQISVTHPEYLTTPFTVAEIYQDLVPYQSYRDRIGVEMNGDYEDALLRMLTGEGDCLLLDSEAALREMREELAGPNPNTALFHEFAALDVRLHPNRVPPGASTEVEAATSEADGVDAEVAGARAEESDLAVEREVGLEREVELEVAVEPAPEAPEVVGHIETAPASPSSSLKGPPPDEPVSTEAEPSPVLTVCHWCREDLPVHDSIHFCPFCGSDLRPAPCRECGEAMEARWQFCASCGADVRG